MLQMVNLQNVNGDTVSVPYDAAKHNFGILYDMEQLVGSAPHAPSGEADDTDDTVAVEEKARPEAADTSAANQPVLIDSLNCDTSVLYFLRDYLQLPDESKTAAIPQPLSNPLAHHIQPVELEMLQRAEREKIHVQLCDVANYLRYSQLFNLCAAYIATRIDEISHLAPNIMDGAQQVRDFLQMENEWTPEEMQLLSEELEYLKQVDPNAR